VSGAGSVQEWSGSTWTSAVNTASAPGEGVGGASKTDVWVAIGTLDATGGELDHWNGTTWDQKVTTSHPMLSVWAADTDDVWAVGQAGLIMYWNGSAWSEEASRTTVNLWTVRGDSTVVWAAGDNGTILMRTR
jgi:hypothetical protein